MAYGLRLSAALMPRLAAQEGANLCPNAIHTNAVKRTVYHGECIAAHLQAVLDQQPPAQALLAVPW